MSLNGRVTLLSSSCIEQPTDTNISLTTDVEGNFRTFTPVSYWEQGVLRGIYYLAVYWLFLNREQRAAMSLIYELSRVTIARSQWGEADQTLAFDAVASGLRNYNHNTIRDLFAYRRGMMAHAFGSKQAAFFAFVDTAFKFQDNAPHSMPIVKELVGQLIGWDTIHSSAVALLGTEYSSTMEAMHEQPTAATTIQTCLTAARNYDYIEKINALIGEGNARHYIADAAASLIIERMKYWSGKQELPGTIEHDLQEAAARYPQNNVGIR